MTFELKVLKINKSTRKVSSWTIVLVSLERMTSVIKPFTAREIFATKRVIFIWTGIVLFLFCLNLHIAWTVAYVEYTDRRGVDRVICFYKSWEEDVAWFWTNIWRWIDYSVMTFIPCAVIVASNAVTVNALWRTRTIR